MRSHAHGADLFSQHARLQRLPDIVEKARTDGHATCDLYCDVSTYQIRIYGSLPYMKKRLYRALAGLSAINGLAMYYLC